VSTTGSYITDPDEIYRQSFATIRAEAELSRFEPAIAAVVVRMIHACGMTDLSADIVASPDFASAGQAALRKGGAVICDVEMVRHGVIKRLLPADNAVICALSDPEVTRRAKELGTTRSAAQVDLWDNDLDGAVVVIGNAPTALFRLLERLAEGAPRPAAIIGVPVGFVGAAESKEALIANARGVPFIVVKGRRGGSAIAAAALNGLSAGLEGHA
jgi:precorrin-8X/cobalt-precorrin-8 methylmutase